MVLVRKAQLFDLVAQSLQLSEWRILWFHDGHPAKVRLIKDDLAIDAWLHIWNLTPGGRPKQMPLERRIQPTGIGDHFRSSRGFRTLILGWSDETGVFAAFDYNYHAGKIGSSSSTQTDLKALKDAAENGLGVFAKATGELSIAVRPDMLGIYVEQMNALHASGKDPDQLAIFRRMAADPLTVDVEDVNKHMPVPRRQVMTQTLRQLRDRRFSRHVLGAYSHHCAMCGVQLRLLDAAHILPVAHPESDDAVTNGVALCALHHRAYDASLVTFNNTYEVIVNRTLSSQLASQGLHGGLAEFKAALKPSLLLPHKLAHHPSHRMISAANKLRGWRF
ncbi:hypothetical protein ASD54_04785 [Rhizobium sp. Root149]|uniref:HNH endonuclease n=1 Tax=Rhizobium sp. Root149 TaxID=1736473 RepID=UPI000712D3F3|nr:HNH endonuclease [Rhizobium sp. Root149]KQZ54645.1 hypothetical protein ASD54_04785 [Rhizobium sp. Root149]